MRSPARFVVLASLAGASTGLFVACGPANAYDDRAPAPQEHVGTRAEAVHHGATAADPAVVALVVRRESCAGPAPVVNCTGVLLTDRAVLTAAHCVEGPARGSFEVFFGTSAATGGSYRGIAEKVLEPRYQKQSDEHDIALVWLTAPAPVAPATLVAAGAVDGTWVGRSARAVGFGESGDDAASPGEKREGTVELSAVQPDTLTYAPSPAMTCRGDSGGPIFVEQDGRELVAALTTSGDALCERDGVAVRIDARLHDFIEPALAAGPPAEVANVAPEAVCAAVCASDADCPADLACGADLDGANRCQVPSLFAGDFGASCSGAADCGDGMNCVPLGDDCRCERACVVPESPNDRTSARAPAPSRAEASCRAAPFPSEPAAGPVALLVLAAAVRRLRRMG